MTNSEHEENVPGDEPSRRRRNPITGLFSANAPYEIAPNGKTSKRSPRRSQTPEPYELEPLSPEWASRFQREARLRMRRSFRPSEGPAVNLPKAWQLPEAIRRRLGTDRIGSQRPIIEDGQLLLILHHLPEYESERQGVYVWMRNEDDWKFYREGEPYDDGADGQVMLEAHLQEYEDAERGLSRQVMRARKSATYLRLLQDIATKRHAARSTYLALQDARAGMAEANFSHNVHIINLRDWAYGIERDFALLYEDTKNALEYRQTQQAEWLNRLIAIFFPMTIATSIIESGLVDSFLSRSLQFDRLITISCVVLGSLLIGVGLYVISSAKKR